MRLNNRKRLGFIKNFIERRLKTRPFVNIGTCVGCADCKRACPTMALNLFATAPDVELRPKTGEPPFRPEVELYKCTRCYRCKEQCPQNAITIYKPRLVRIFRL